MVPIIAPTQPYVQEVCFMLELFVIPSLPGCTSGHPDFLGLYGVSHGAELASSHASSPCMLLLLLQLSVGLYTLYVYIQMDSSKLML